MTPGVYLVEFPGQYKNADRERECRLDRFGVWHTATGGAMPEPKEVADGFRIRLICAPRFTIPGYLKRQPRALHK
jgi:hypothetical protein